MKSQELMMSSYSKTHTRKFTENGDEKSSEYSDLKFVQLECIFHISNGIITIKVEKGSYC